MGHDSQSSAAHHHGSGLQNARMVPLVLLLFFALSAVGHYIFVVRDGHHAEPAAHGAVSQGVHPDDRAPAVPAQEQDKH